MKWLTEIQDRAQKDIQRITARLAELDVERKQLMKMRDAYKALTGHKDNSTSAVEEPKENIKDMAIMIMQDAGKPLALKDIYARMVELGMNFTGASPKMSIYAALNRNRDTFHNTKDKRWELVSEKSKSTYAEELTT